MKKLTFWLLSTLFVLSACNSVEELPPTDSSEGDYSLSVGLDKGVQTRANDLSNITMLDHDQRYVLEIYHIYKAGDGTKTSTLYKRLVQLNDADFNFRLVKDQTYEFLVWADYSKTGSKEDLHYATGQQAFVQNEKIFEGGLRAISLTGDYLNNAHCRDAFFGYVEIANIGKENTNVEITCTRPFGQLNITTTDWNSFRDLVNLKPEAVQIEIKNVFTQFDVKTGNVSVPGNISYAGNASMAGLPTEDILDPETGEIAFLQKRHLTCDYLFATSKTIANIYTGTKITFFNADGNKITDTGGFLANLPIKRNHKTFVIGKLLSRTGQLTVNVNSDWNALSPNEESLGE